MLHSLTISKGYSVSNHICIGCYLRDVLKRDDSYRLFDDLRYKRNSLVYYGNKMDFETAITKAQLKKIKKQKIILLLQQLFSPKINFFSRGFLQDF